MKKFIFSLEKVLRFHEQELDVKKQELAAIKVSLHELDLQIQQKKLELVQLNQEMSRAITVGLNARDLAVYKMYFRTAEHQIRQLEEQRADLQIKADEKQESVVQSNQEISGLEKLKDKQLNQYNDSTRKQQELEIEEFISQGIMVS
ncbi:MAG: flagellar export protein FliJ [Clostridium sp.]|uniref:flagellar export protein FliJ n=1 Tax=Clostridium sp. TaxID=1506 RepID=UPI0029121E80|nr:flagellar export protein FliJ [Clostridium sp.]MDU7336992.1 flagellar export protein FliJ [Clostridium sp.]